VLSSGWNAHSAIARCPVISWQGSAWRIHRQRYQATDSGGSLKVSGRYHRGADRFAADETWPALYLALSPETALGELIRHVTPELLPHLNGYRISELAVELEAVVDCRDVALLGLQSAALVNDHDVELTQQIGAAIVATGHEGLLVPSATGLGDNLVVFPTNLRPASRLDVGSSRDPRLFIPNR
jgi:RES domain-containing protein